MTQTEYVIVFLKQNRLSYVVNFMTRKEQNKNKSQYNLTHRPGP